MPKPVNIIGKRFGNLTVIERSKNTKHGATQWLCKCDCGNEIIVPVYTLQRGVIQNCGCVKQKHHNATHGESNTPLYNLWHQMIYRCEKPNNHAYKDYGSRGIRVCEEWHDFITFKKWAEETRPSTDYTLDRIDNNKDYSPDNCKWSNKKEQANNRRSNVKLEYQGEVHDLTEWSEILGFDYKRVHNRMFKLGWSFEKAITTPVEKKKRNKAVRNKHGGISC